jgi:peptidoglycan hydrolase CwlO-like protein
MACITCIKVSLIVNCCDVVQANIIKELEGRVQQLTAEVDGTLAQRSSLEKEKKDLEDRFEKVATDLEETRHV